MAAVGARPVSQDRLAGQVRATAVAAVVVQLRRSVTGGAGAGYALQRQDAGRAKGVSRSGGAAGFEKWQSGLP